MAAQRRCVTCVEQRTVACLALCAFAAVTAAPVDQPGGAFLMVQHRSECDADLAVLGESEAQVDVLGPVVELFVQSTDLAVHVGAYEQTGGRRSRDLSGRVADVGPGASTEMHRAYEWSVERQPDACVLHGPVDRLAPERTSTSVHELCADGDGRIVRGDEHAVEPVVVERRDVVVEQQDPRGGDLCDGDLVGRGVAVRRGENDAACTAMCGDDSSVVGHTGVVDDDRVHLDAVERCEQRLEPAGLEGRDDHCGDVGAPGGAIRGRREPGEGGAQLALAVRGSQAVRCCDGAPREQDGAASQWLGGAPAEACESTPTPER